MIERIRYESGRALRLGSQVALAVLVLLYCVGCVSSTPDRGDEVETLEPSATAIPPGGFRTMRASTATPVSTATVRPRRSFLRWGVETLPQIEIIGDAADTIVDLMDNPVFGDATWTALIAAQVVRIREADGVLRDVVPPEKCREAHAMLLSSTGDALLGAEYLLKSVQQLDPDLLKQGAEYAASADAKMDLFTQMVEDITP